MIESSIIFLPCRNLQETEKFYTEVIGAKISHRDEAGSIWVDSGYGYIGFCCYGDGRAMAQGVCISFNLESQDQVDEMYLRLSKTEGLKGLTVPERHPVFSVYSFFFEDPNGYTVEFQKIF